MKNENLNKINMIPPHLLKYDICKKNILDQELYEFILDLEWRKFAIVTDKQRICINEIVFNNENHTSLAQKLNVSVPNVRDKFIYGIERLKRAYEILKFKNNLDFKDILKQPIQAYPFSQRTKNCLASIDCFYLEDMIKLSEEEFLGLRNFGKKSLNEIKNACKELGLDLRQK